MDIETLLYLTATLVMVVGILVCKARHDIRKLKLLLI